MTLEQMLMVGAAAAVGLWPGIKSAGKAALAALKRSPKAASEERPDFQAAIANLALVRARLSGTELLDDTAKKAIDALTLALVAGSDK